jgi:hypothetical protein
MRSRTGRFHQPRWLFLAACLGWAVVGSVGCRDPHGLSGTAFFITVNWDDNALAVNQLRFIGTSGSQTIFGPSLRPEDAGLTGLVPPETVRVLLPESLNNFVIDVEVDGLWLGRENSTRTAQAVAEQGLESDFSVELARLDGGSDGGTDGGDGG